jgi:hypothetical protein
MCARRTARWIAVHCLGILPLDNARSRRSLRVIFLALGRWGDDALTGQFTLKGRAVSGESSCHKLVMTDRPTKIERAFIIAASSTVSTMGELRAILRAEGYPEDGHLHGRVIMTQLSKLIAQAQPKSEA